MRSRGLHAALLVVCAFAFYAVTLAPGLMPGDTGDMALAASTLREAHPPGYPLYALFGKLFIAMPIGDIPYRANLMAAFLGGLSVAFVFLALTILTRHAVASLAGALLFAFNTLFWTYFVVAEAFCLNNFFLALTAFLALLWRERHRQDPGGSAGRQALVLLAFTAGLSLGNHQTMVLTFPGLLLFVAATDRTALRPARLAALAGWFGFGLALAYAYLPIAALLQHSHTWEDTGTWKGLLRLFLRAKYGTFQLDTRGDAAVTPLGQTSTYLAALGSELLWVGLALGAAGVVAAWRRDRSFLLYSAGGFLLGIAFLMRAGIDPSRSPFDAAILQRFTMLPSFFFLLWAGVGLAALAERLPWRWWPALLLLPAALLAINSPKASQRGNRLYPRFLSNAIDTLPPNAILLCETDEVALGADYLFTVEGRRPDVAFILTGLLGSEPYTGTVRRRYPHLAWPDGVGRAPSRLRPFLAANLPRHRVFMDDRPRGLGLPHVRCGLVYEVRAPGQLLSAAEFVRMNEALWRGFDLRGVDTRLYAPDSMCASIVLFSYLSPRFHLAREYNALGYHSEARGHLKACAAMDGRGIVSGSEEWREEMERAR